MEKKEISGKVKINNASFNGIVNAASVDLKSSIINNDNINACVAERGVAGFSPVANVIKNGDDVTITITDYKGTTTATIPDMSDEVERIEALIPSTASTTNKLVDSATLNSSVQTATSNFRGDWATYADIPTDASLYPVDAAGVRTPSTNDYLVVMTDEEKNGGTWRYKYVGLWSVDGKNGWQAEYQVNETPFTADQLAAINSGITSELVEEIGGGGGGLEIGDIGIAPLGIDETKGKRRYLNGQLIIQEQYVEFTNKVKSAVALYPTLACTETEWQTTATMSVGGQVGKFVVDDEAGTIRLPKIIMPIQGLTDLSKLAEIVEAGLPNITGYTSWQVNGIYNGYFGNATANNTNNGALYVSGSGKYGAVGVSGADSTTSGTQVNINASRSNPIYGNSDTVQQEQIQYPYFIQVATGAETEDNIVNEIELNNPFFLGMSQYFETAPNNSSWLKSEGQWNANATYPTVYDWALINANNSIEGFKFVTDTYTDYDYVINTADETFRLPLLNGSEDLTSNKSISLTLGSAGSTYTAPANGWYSAYYSGSSNGWFKLEVGGLQRASITNTNGQNIQSGIILPVTKGTVVSTWYNGITTLNEFRFIYAKGNGSLYFYVGETVQNANLINAGRIEEKLVDKLDKSAVKAYITETYVNGSSWYRVWSDGWCEQCGKTASIASNQKATVTFLKNFKDTNISVILQRADAGYGNFTPSYYSLTTSGMGIWNNETASNASKISWYACGYIA